MKNLMEQTSQKRKIAFVGNHLPRKCGIATFTSDLLAAIASTHPQSDCFAVAVNDIEGGYEYPNVVRFAIEEQDLASYERAADFINLSNAEIVCLQHEFGIFGGPAGSHLLALLDRLKAPVVTTLHTVLRQPNADQRRVMQELIARSARLAVMTERGQAILQEDYQAPPTKIDLIPHGIPDVPLVDPEHYKRKFDLGGKKVLLTFGLLSPNKGIENVINALPDILAEFPDVVYVVLGATHPNELRARGEAYRFLLEELVKRNKIENSVIFHNRFVALEELTSFIGAADIYITPYINEGQIPSGTLAYAFGAGKAVISTPYSHAAELLRDQRGVLVPFADSTAIAREVTGLLRDTDRRSAMCRNAYELGREMIWSSTARIYMRSFESAQRQVTVSPRKVMAARGFSPRPHESPDLNLDHLWRMTDSTGIFQHAVFTTPNLAEGYCTDDNARALIVAVLLEQLKEDPQRVRKLKATYVAFLEGAFRLDTARFRNFLSSDRRWLDDLGSEDCHGRALWGLGVAVGRSPHSRFQITAQHLFAQAIPAAVKFTSPRAWAFSLIGIHEHLQRMPGDDLAGQARDVLSARLVDLFDRVARPDWCWFEEKLTYDNAKLAHALIVTGRATGQTAVYERGMRALRWLVQVQTSGNGQLRPIGSNGFYQRHGSRADFDQQPIEAQATVSACLEAYRATSDSWWYEQAQTGFDWFLGWNDLGLELYSSETGGCCDGLHADRANANQGAESMLAFLLSLAEMRLMQSAVTGIPKRSLAAAVTQ